MLHFSLLLHIVGILMQGFLFDQDVFHMLIPFLKRLKLDEAGILKDRILLVVDHLLALPLVLLIQHQLKVGRILLVHVSQIRSAWRQSDGLKVDPRAVPASEILKHRLVLFTLLEELLKLDVVPFLLLSIYKGVRLLPSLLALARTVILVDQPTAVNSQATKGTYVL